MKRAIFAVIVLLIAVSVSHGQNYWHIKTSLLGVAAVPGDDKGTGLGAGIVASFGPPDGPFEVGFEARKWFRSYTIFDEKMKTYSDSGVLRIDGLPGGAPIDKSDGQADYDDDGLSFAVLFKYRVIELTPSIGFYSGAGTGLYFISARREQLKQNPSTGFWYIEKADYYLESKIQALFLTGFDWEIKSRLDLFLEGRFTYISGFDRWDNAYVYDGGLGFRYNF